MILDGTTHKVYQGVRAFGTGTLNNCDLHNIKYEESGPAYVGLGLAILDNWT